MGCKVKIGKDESVIYAWTDDCVDIVEAVLQPLPSQKLGRTYKTTQLRAFNLSTFLRTKGVDVNIEIEDPSEHARFTIWTQKLKSANEIVTDELIENFVEEMGINYRELQVRGLSKVLKSNFALLAVRCGGGKTLLNLSVVQFKKRMSGKVLAVVVAPAACAEEYEKELNRFRGYFDLTMLNTCGMSGKSAACAIREAEADVILVSVDSIASLKNIISNKMQNFDGESVLIVEEGHSAKNTASKRSLGLQVVAPLFDQVIVSTATPMPMGPKDIRGYIGLVGLPQPIESYANGIPIADYQFLKGVAFVTDEADMPYAPLTTSSIEFDDLEDLNSQISVAVKNEVEMGKKVVIFTSTNKALHDAYSLFEGIPRTVLSGSFSVHHPASECLIDGRSREAQQKAIEDFNTDPNCMILIANYRVGSTGLNLQYSGARMAIFYEITNSGADFFQSKYRIRRPNVFPTGGFRYLYAVPTEPRLRRTVNRQFIKLAEQERVLGQLKSSGVGAP